MGIQFYRDANLPFFEIKSCDSEVHAARKHAHEEFSLGLILAGSSLISGAGQNFPINAGSTILIPPNVIHRCNPKNIKNWQFKMLYLKAEWVKSVVGELPPNLYIAVKHLNCIDYGNAVQLFTILQSNLTGLEKETQLISGLNYLLDFENYFNLNPGNYSADLISLEYVRDYLQEHFLEKVSLADLVRISGLSKYHLIRIFKRVYQTSPHSYQTMLRLNYAKDKLKKRAAGSITTIAQDAGFFDQSHFIKMFKLYHGITPLNYRQSE